LPPSKGEVASRSSPDIDSANENSSLGEAALDCSSFFSTHWPFSSSNTYATPEFEPIWSWWGRESTMRSPRTATASLIQP
jgi:hypothetical protein